MIRKRGMMYPQRSQVHHPHYFVYLLLLNQLIKYVLENGSSFQKIADTHSRSGRIAAPLHIPWVVSGIAKDGSGNQSGDKPFLCIQNICNAGDVPDYLCPCFVGLSIFFTVFTYILYKECTKIILTVKEVFQFINGNGKSYLMVSIS